MRTYGLPSTETADKMYEENESIVSTRTNALLQIFISYNAYITFSAS